MPLAALALLQARIGKLESGLRRVALAASIFDQSFTVGQVAKLLHRQEAEVQSYMTSLAEAEILKLQDDAEPSGGSTYRFRTALLREAAHALLRPADRETGRRV